MIKSATQVGEQTQNGGKAPITVDVMKNLPLNVLGRERARTAATGLACVRAAIGAAALILPELLLRPWIGADEAAATGAKLAGRALGGRDLALAAGPFLAMRHDAPVRGWVEGGMLSDLCDTVATLIAFRNLPPRSRWLVLASSAGAVVAGLVVAAGVDEAATGPG